jgi:hydroxymethylpyrimidine/phosphomethylpyrimidine kinase
MTVVTAVTAQNTRAVAAIHALPADLVAAQIEAVLSDIGADAIKIGMLANAAIVRAVAASLRRWAGPTNSLPIVLDPVMVAKSGDPLLASDAIEALVEELFPLATLATPNLPEAELLGGAPARPARSVEERARLGASLAGRGPAILLKGGHAVHEDGRPTAEITDLLCFESAVEVFRHARIETDSTHGTGCTLSSAIAAGLGSGLELRRAVTEAIAYLQGALAAAYPVGSTGSGGHGPPDHLYRQGASDD